MVFLSGSVLHRLNLMKVWVEVYSIFIHLLRFLVGLLLECIYPQTTFIFLLFKEKTQKKVKLMISLNGFKGANCNSQSVLFIVVKV